MQIRQATSADKTPWDAYVLSHPDSTHCHLYGWKEVIEKAYGHRGYYLLAEKDSKIVGALPLIHMKSFLFGNQLVSMPFLNYGGLLADSAEAAEELIKEAMGIASSLKASSIELRHHKPIPYLNPTNQTDQTDQIDQRDQTDQTDQRDQTDQTDQRDQTDQTDQRDQTDQTDPIPHKVRMLLTLPDSKDDLLKSFKAKLRSQISRPLKEGMQALIGGRELIDPFYRVFAVNMRDLGSPVHSRKLFREIGHEFPKNVKICVVQYQDSPVAAGLVFCHQDTLEIPWASSLKDLNRFSPNMLLYWSLIEYGCDQGFKSFDFGRSTPDEGTYRFKEQWGARPVPLYWHTLASNGQAQESNRPDKSKYEKLIHYWKRLPLPVAEILGPLIRKHISL
jgi:serine/alanine adding enzyme